MSLLSSIEMPTCPQDTWANRQVWEEYYEACACAERAMRADGEDF